MGPLRLFMNYASKTAIYFEIGKGYSGLPESNRRLCSLCSKFGATMSNKNNLICPKHFSFRMEKQSRPYQSAMMLDPVSIASMN